MTNTKELYLLDVAELYVELGNLEEVAEKLSCTRQHIDNEIKRQLGYEQGGIKKLILEFYTKPKMKAELKRKK